MTKWQVCGAGFWDLRQGHWTSLPRLQVTRLCALTTVVIVIQVLSHVWLFGTPWTAACQASLSFTISWSLLKLMSIESVMSSNHLILCHPLLLHSIFPSIRVFFNRQLFASGGQSIGASASIWSWILFSFNIPMNIQGWFPWPWQIPVPGVSSKVSPTGQSPGAGPGAGRLWP